MNRSNHSQSRIKPTMKPTSNMSAAMRTRASQEQKRTPMRAPQSSTHVTPQTSDDWLRDCLFNCYNEQGGQPR